MSDVEPPALPNRPGPDHCPRGGAHEANAEQPGHCRRCGQFLIANSDRASHRLYSARDLTDLQAEVAAFLVGSISDDGGAENISTRRRADLEYRARLHRRIIQLDNAIEHYGLCDRRHKLRVAWLSMLATLIDRARSLDSMLGLDRKARAVNFQDRLASAIAAKAEREARP